MKWRAVEEIGAETSGMGAGEQEATIAGMWPALMDLGGLFLPHHAFCNNPYVIH